MNAAPSIAPILDAMEPGGPGEAPLESGRSRGKKRQPAPKMGLVSGEEQRF